MVEVAVGVLPGEKEVGVPSIGYKTKDDGRHLFRPIIIHAFSSASASASLYIRICLYNPRVSTAVYIPHINYNS